MRKISIESILTVILSVIVLLSCQKDDEPKPEDDELKPAELSSILIKTAPIKVDYYVGDVLDLSGLVITLVMDNDESEDVAFLDFEIRGITCSPINGTELVSNLSVVTVTHSASNKTVDQTINYMKFTDIDGNKYKIVKLGEQFWMEENLKTTKYNDGTAIPLVTDDTEWRNLISSAYCWYNNDKNSYSSHGALYNWYTVNTEKLCPIGWHIPNDEEWKQLEINMGMSQSEADKEGWRGTNEGSDLKGIGFTDFIGERYDYGFKGIDISSNWWTSSESSDYNTNAWTRTIRFDFSDIYRTTVEKQKGFSVRCVKD